MSTGKNRRKSRKWVQSQQKDAYVRKASVEGVRARSFYKLEQIDQKYRLIRSSSTVVDLGSAPGGWTQYAARRVSSPEQIVAVDLLPMATVPGVRFVQGDIREEEVQRDVLALLGESGIDLVLSDMAPNISGIRSRDEANVELILVTIFSFCELVLRRNGDLLMKLFEGDSADRGRYLAKAHFDRIITVKPDASRASSREFYLLGRGYRATGTP